MKNAVSDAAVAANDVPFISKVTVATVAPSLGAMLATTYMEIPAHTGPLARRSIFRSPSTISVGGAQSANRPSSSSSAVVR